MAEAQNEVCAREVGSRGPRRPGHVRPRAAPWLGRRVHDQVRAAVGAQHALEPVPRERGVPALEHRERLRPARRPRRAERRRDLLQRLIPRHRGPASRAPRAVATQRCPDAVRVHEFLQAGEPRRTQATGTQRVRVVALQPDRQSIQEPHADSASGRAHPAQRGHPALHPGPTRRAQRALLRHGEQTAREPSRGRGHDAGGGQGGEKLAPTECAHEADPSALIGDSPCSPRPHMDCGSRHGSAGTRSSRDGRRTGWPPARRARCLTPRLRGRRCRRSSRA